MIKNILRRTCFDCRIAEIDPGDPGCRTFSNGDPGYPPEPATAICTDPLAGKMAEEYDDIQHGINQAISRIIWENTDDVIHNCKPGEGTKIGYNLKAKMCRDLTTYEDFAPYCPMFHQRMMICQSCKAEVPASDIAICDKCEAKYVAWEKEHQENLDFVIWHEPYTPEEMSEVEEVLNNVDLGGLEL